MVRIDLKTAKTFDITIRYHFCCGWT